MLVKIDPLVLFGSSFSAVPITVLWSVLEGSLVSAFALSSASKVDLLCGDARLAIELDGAQHLGSADAYRRDRRKDALLQENGYTVLRFLAEDVGKHLDDVLDSILRAISCLKKP